jgi:hypothetical protein
MAMTGLKVGAMVGAMAPMTGAMARTQGSSAELAAAQVVDIVRRQRIDGDHHAADGLRDLVCRAPIELGLHEDHLDLVPLGLVDQRRQPARAGLLALALDGHLGEPVGVGEVAPGRVEHHELAVGQWIEQRVQVPIEQSSSATKSSWLRANSAVWAGSSCASLSRITPTMCLTSGGLTQTWGSCS